MQLHTWPTSNDFRRTSVQWTTRFRQAASHGPNASDNSAKLLILIAAVLNNIEPGVLIEDLARLPGQSAPEKDRYLLRTTRPHALPPTQKDPPWYFDTLGLEYFPKRVMVNRRHIGCSRPDVLCAPLQHSRIDSFRVLRRRHSSGV